MEALEIPTPFLVDLMNINIKNVLVFEWRAILTLLRKHNI